MTRQTRGQPPLVAHVEKVTPQLAEEWIGKNVHNRVIRERPVAAYARDMAAGRWMLSGETIKFAVDGSLLDGQHRLHAVIRADTPVEMLVVRGVEPAAQEVMDSGVARTAGDAIRLRGDTSHYTAVAAAARMCVLVESGRSIDGGGMRVTTPEMLEFIDANPALVTAVDMATAYRSHIDIPYSVLSYAVWRLSQVDFDACNLFITRVADKTDLTKGDSILALINRLAEIRRNGRRASRSDYLSLLFRAWNYWRDGRQVTSLPLTTRGESIPEPL